MLKKFMKNKKGFTLIELVVVVAILGVLALLIVPNVVNRVNEARDAVLEANVKVINNAIKMYYTIEGDYPDIGTVQQGSSKIEELIKVLKTNNKYLDNNDIDDKALDQLKKAESDGKIDVQTIEGTDKVTHITINSPSDSTSSEGTNSQ
nr:MAG: hypothetical protein DIU64_13530 [Caldicoprobacter oshimai]